MLPPLPPSPSLRHLSPSPTIPLFYPLSPITQPLFLSIPLPPPLLPPLPPPLPPLSIISLPLPLSLPLSLYLSPFSLSVSLTLPVPSLPPSLSFFFLLSVSLFPPPPCSLPPQSPSLSPLFISLTLSLSPSHFLSLSYLFILTVSICDMYIWEVYMFMSRYDQPLSF